MSVNLGWEYEQSAVIPYQIVAGIPQILLITSLKKKRWVLPKGLIEPGMSPQDSAAKEAREEAGIGGTVLPDCLGTYQYEKWKGICTVEVFLMKVTFQLDHWLEQGLRNREWVSVEEAVSRIKEPDLKAIIAKAPELMTE